MLFMSCSSERGWRKSFDSLVNRDLNLFLMECSFLLLLSFFDIEAHFFPLYFTYSINMKSSDSSQYFFSFDGSKWFNQRYRHCLAVLKYFLLDSMNKAFPKSLHLNLYLSLLTKSSKSSSSSCTHFLYWLWFFRRLLAWYSNRIFSLVGNRVEKNSHNYPVWVKYFIPFS